MKMIPALRSLALTLLHSLALVALLVSGRPAGLWAQAAPLTGLDAYVETAMGDWGVPGLALAVVRNDTVLYARGYGVLEVGKEERVDENTLFAIASTTKAMTVAALGMLVDEEKLEWNDPVRSYLPEFELQDPWVTRELMVRDLLTHRVGVAREDNLWIAGPFDREEVLRRARYLPQVNSFRARYGYNNIMFIAAGEVVGRVAGTTWDEFLGDRLFRPLGMDRTTTRTEVAEQRGNVAASHMRLDGRVQSVPRRNYDNIGGAGAVFSSARDMAQWLRLHLGGGEFEGRRLLSASVLRDMYSPQTVIPLDSVARRMFPDTHFRAYGLGWNVQDYRGRELVNHSGSINYTRTQVALMPSEGIGVVVMANLTSSNLQLALMYRILDALLGFDATDWSAEYLTVARRGEERSGQEEQELEEARLEGTSPSLDMEGYAGTYTSQLYGDLEVAAEGAALVLRYAPDYVADLEHWHHDVFRAVWRRKGEGRAFVNFQLDERARIRSMELEGFGLFRRSSERN